MFNQACLSLLCGLSVSPVAAFGFPVDGASPGGAVTFTLDNISEEGLLVPIAFPGHKVGRGVVHCSCACSGSYWVRLLGHRVCRVRCTFGAVCVE